jgi:hypothetical protein
MTFHVGQKVVCVNDTPPTEGRELQIRKDAIYTVAACFEHWTREWGVQLCELTPTGGPGWHVWRFRPVIERKTDSGVAILKKIARDVTERKPVKISERA